MKSDIGRKRGVTPVTNDFTPVPGEAPSELLSRSAGVSAHTSGRILSVVSLKDTIELGGMFLHPERLVEELFCCNDEEFGFAYGPVGAEK